MTVNFYWSQKVFYSLTIVKFQLSFLKTHIFTSHCQVPLSFAYIAHIVIYLAAFIINI